MSDLNDVSGFGYLMQFNKSFYFKDILIRKDFFQNGNFNYAPIKGQFISKGRFGFLNSSKKRTKLTILSKEVAQDNEFRSFFGRIEDTINCFRDLLTFSKVVTIILKALNQHFFS